MKWSKKWAAEVKREEGAGARREGAGTQRAWAARSPPLESEQRGRFKRLPVRVWKGVGAVKSGKESSLRDGRGRDSGPTPGRAPLLNYL